MTEDAARDRMFELHMQNYERNRMYPPTNRKDQTMNPEKVLEEIAIAIKHRTISTIHRWNIVYYYGRITCVPTYVNVPEQIILHEFTEKMLNEGFSVVYWNQLKANVIKLYEELQL